MTDENGFLGSNLNRRDFIRGGALLGGTAALAAQAPWLLTTFETGAAKSITPTAEYALAKPENIIYTVCRVCNVQCPIKVKFADGVALKIDGSAYSPQNMAPHLPYKTSPFDAATIDGRACPKALSAIQYVYDPYRITKVIKRSGPRGSGKWETIPFEQAISEIVNGGKLFAKVRGEEDRQVEGLKDIWALRDGAVFSKMSGDVSKILAEKDAAKKKDLIAKFKTDHAGNLDKLIDPDHPDFGPKNNQFVFEGGRMEPGREALFNRFFGAAFGTTNIYTAGGSICSASVYQARTEVTNEFVEGKWTGGKKEFALDALNGEFLLAFGINYFEGRAMAPYAARITDGLATGRLKMAVVDPRLSKMAGKAWKWLPVKPGADGALAMGMIRWIIENERFDARYLNNANKAAAKADGEPTVSNAAWLVKVDDKGNGTAFLRASEIKLAEKEQRPTAAGGEWTFDPFVVSLAGELVAFDPNDEKKAVEGDLLVERTIGGIKVKTAFQLLKQLALSKPAADWSKLSGISERDIAAVADEFTSHGKKAATAEYRGVTAHTNSFVTTQAIWALNLLIGNVGWTGGQSAGGGGWDDMGAKKGQPYPLVSLHPGKVSAFGLKITRQGSKYDESTLFAGYPAKRPWIPIPGGAMRHDIYPSMLEGYPYKARALFSYFAGTVNQAPGGQGLIKALQDTTAIPLHFACDIVIGENSMYADYIFPDTTVWESWGFPGSIPEVPQKLLKVRQPAIAPIPTTAKAFGEEMPINVESICLALAEQLKLPGFGPSGLANGVDLSRAEDFYLKRVANVAFGDKEDGTDAVPDADDAEMTLFEASRRHLPASVYDVNRWKAAVKPELWRKVVYVLNRGGRFQDFEDAWKGKQLASVPKGVMAIFAENVAKARNSMTGASFSGVGRWEPPADLLGNEIQAADGEFSLISYKEAAQGHSRTMSGYWALSTYPENLLYINRQDAERLKLGDGDRVRVTSRTNPGTLDIGNGGKAEMVVKVKPIAGIRPGVLALSSSFGHWAWGSRDIVIDGKLVKGDPRRGKGMMPNHVVPFDPKVPTAISQELIAGSSASYDAKVKIAKV